MKRQQVTESSNRDHRQRRQGKQVSGDRKVLWAKVHDTIPQQQFVLRADTPVSVSSTTERPYRPAINVPGLLRLPAAGPLQKRAFPIRGSR